jgi:hypothetical protein
VTLQKSATCTDVHRDNYKNRHPAPMCIIVIEWYATGTYGRLLFLLLQYLLQSCSRGGWGGETMEDMCYEGLRAEACVD